jgi:hypothetical protein
MAEERQRVMVRLGKKLDLEERLKAEEKRTNGLAKQRIIEQALDKYLPALPGKKKGA